MRIAGVLIGLASAWSMASAEAQPITVGTPGCGGDAFSSAEVIEHRPPRRGPITAVPDTLCADVAPQQPPAQVDIYANPIVLPENGGRGGRAPYDERPRRGGPPRP